MATGKNTTPLRAIRQRCLWCGLGSTDEVRLCPAGECPLHELRFGRGAGRGGSPLKAIRDYCKGCAGGIGLDELPTRKGHMEVKACEGRLVQDSHHGGAPCPLHPFRLGTNPARARNAPSS